MTNESENIIADLNINRLLIAILNEIKEVKIPTISLVDVDTVEKELVLTYDEESTSFTVSLRDKNEQS